MSWHFEVRDKRGTQMTLVQSTSKKGHPCCLFCGKTIPRFRRRLSKLPSPDAAFHSDGCAIRFAMHVVRDVVKGAKSPVAPAALDAAEVSS